MTTKGKDSRFCIIGGGGLPCLFIHELVNYNFVKPLIVTWKDHLHSRDRMLLKDSPFYEDIFKVCDNYDIPLLEVENPNKSKFLDVLDKEGIDIVFSICSRWIFSKHFIKSFKGKIINIHLGDLPKERGGAIVSRKILNGNNMASATIHVITPAIDQGPIIYKDNLEVKAKYPTVHSFNEYENKIAKKLFKQLLEDLVSGKEDLFIGTKQDDEQSIYLPQLYTEVNGAIDWSWTANEIERFIRAFGPPFPGAFTFYGKEKVSILKSSIRNSPNNFHPYYSGRIIGKKDDGSVKVAVGKKILIVHEIRYKGDLIVPSSVLKLSRILHTPIETLEIARTDLVKYDKMEPPN